MKKKFLFNLMLGVAAIMLAVCMVSLISCSGKERGVEFSDEDGQCFYQDNTYISFPDGNNETYWEIYPQSYDIKQVDKMPFALFRTFSRKPIYVTKEDCPNFVIVHISSHKEEKITPRFSFAYIREDLELTSIYETEFEFITVEYNKNLSEVDQRFENIPSGVDFYDLVDESTKTHILPEGASYYCTLYCSYPGLNYLQCRFSIFIAENVYYLNVYEDVVVDGKNYHDTYYKFIIPEEDEG